MDAKTKPKQFSCSSFIVEDEDIYGYHFAESGKYCKECGSSEELYIKCNKFYCRGQSRYEYPFDGKVGKYTRCDLSKKRDNGHKPPKVCKICRNECKLPKCSYHIKNSGNPWNRPNNCDHCMYTFNCIFATPICHDCNEVTKCRKCSQYVCGKTWNGWSECGNLCVSCGVFVCGDCTIKYGGDPGCYDCNREYE